MDFYALQLPIALVTLGATALMLHAFLPQLAPRRLHAALVTAVALLLLYSFRLCPTAAAGTAAAALRFDGLALFAQRLLLAVTALGLGLAAGYAPLRARDGVEFQVLSLFAAAGMLLLTMVNDFLLLFVALELVTVTFYVLVSYLRESTPALEAGVKYLILGALSAGVLVYGVSYIYGATGHLDFPGIRAALAGSAAPARAAYRFGLLLVLLGLGFKLAMVPMQVWAPDVYQGAPTPTTALLASGSKLAGFIVLVRLVGAGLIPAEPRWGYLFGALALLTLLYGTLGALGQRDLKRLLGYSSIAHAGYLLLGITVHSVTGLAAVLFYLAPYVFSVLAIFLVLVAVSNAGGVGADRHALAGLHRRAPLLALTLFLALLSLAGVPPLGGALGKLFLLLALVERGTPGAWALAAAAVLAAVVSLYVYLRIVRAAFLTAPKDAAPIALGWPLRLGLGVCLAAMVGWGVWPRPLWTAALQHARELLAACGPASW